VGAGRGTIAFGWKGGIGTSSRVTPAAAGGYTVGVLVQSNFGGILTINGAPVGRELGQYSFRRETGGAGSDPTPDGSIMMVVATDAPLDSRNLERLASRALIGLGRTGATESNGSGDYVIAFSAAASVRRTGGSAVRTVEDLSNDAMTPLFQAVAEATEEAVYNSLFRAESVEGPRGVVAALPLDRTLDVLRKYGVLNWDRTLGARR
jgi:D-aminopeptidase